MTANMQTAIQQQERQHLHRLPNEQSRVGVSSTDVAFAFCPFTVARIIDASRQQISPSLQRLQHPYSPVVSAYSDSYRLSWKSQESTYSSVNTSWDRVRDLPCIGASAGRREVVQASIAAPVSKVVASFVGRVESLIGDSATVLLVNEQTDERLESQCDADMLHENGIGAGDEFRCEVVRSKGTTTTRLSRLSPKMLSKERVEQIHARFKDRWTF